MRPLWAAALVVLLAGCATGPGLEVDDADTRAALAERAETLASWARWGLTGRLSVDDGQEGGSGRLDWDVQEAQSTLRFRGALGQGAWQLHIEPGSATLHKADGSVASAATLDTLVRTETGWHVPVDALEWWVRGLPQPGYEYRARLAAEGRPIELKQRGWEVVYQDYTSEAGAHLPRILEATDGDHRVKLAISRWRHAGPSG